MESEMGQWEWVYWAHARGIQMSGRHAIPSLCHLVARDSNFKHVVIILGQGLLTFVTVSRMLQVDHRVEEYNRVPASIDQWKWFC